MTIAALSSLHIDAPQPPRQLGDPFVLESRQLRPGVRLGDTSRFSEDVWRLEAAQLKAHDRALILNFPRIPVRFRAAIKKLFYHLLSGPLPDGEDRVGIDTIRRYFGEFVRFTNWLEQRWVARVGDVQLSALTGPDLEAYLRHLLITLPSGSTRVLHAQACVRLLWRWRTVLGSDALAFDPLHLDEWSRPHAKRNRAENATSRLPEAVLGPLVVWSLRFINDFAPDILDGNGQWQARREGKEALPTRTAAEVAVAVSDFLSEHVRCSRPLPGFLGQPNILQIAQTLRVGRRRLDDHAEAIRATAELVGVSSSAGLGITIHGRLDGRPWVTDLQSHHTSPHGLAVLSRNLQVSAYVIIAFLSGMRDCEVKHLRRGCLHVQRDTDGNPYRWKVTSLAFKGENDSAGVQATWVVGEPVAHAIKILEALQPPEVDYLFTGLPHGPGSKKTQGRTVLCTGTTNLQLNNFVQWINTYCMTNERTDGVPEVDGRLLQLKTSHFRRTLAWFIARRPGGVVAGALQYRHHSIQMFEGYAGTSESGFRAEVESEQALARSQIYLNMIEAHEHLQLAGPAAEEAAQRLQDFGNHAQFQGRVVLDEERLRRVMKRHDPAVYPGDYVTCVHDATKALCEKARQGRAEDMPRQGGCQPLACHNVALTPGNGQTWKQQLNQIEGRLAAHPPLPPLLQHRLQNRRAEITRFLANNGLLETSS